MNYGFNEDKQRVEVIPKADCKAYIVEEWHSGTEGYIVYSNGFCEQWGVCSPNSWITLYKAYKDTNYNVVTSRYTNATGTGGGSSSLVGKVETARIYFDTGWNSFWQACGFIA